MCLYWNIFSLLLLPTRIKAVVAARRRVGYFEGTYGPCSRSVASQNNCVGLTFRGSKRCGLDGRKGSCLGHDAYANIQEGEGDNDLESWAH